MAEYEKCKVYEIGGPSAWDTMLFKTKDKMLAKLGELLSGDHPKEFVIRYNPDGQLIVGFNEDTQKVGL